MATRTQRASRTQLTTGRLSRIWRDYSLSILVGGLFLASFLLHGVFGWWQYSADQQQHGSEVSVWGPDGYAIYFGEWTFQNWQSEFLEVLLLIVLTKYFLHKGSPESRDSSDEQMAAIKRIEKKLDKLEGKA
jgi:uncharacterized protein DUF6766